MLSLAVLIAIVFVKEDTIVVSIVCAVVVVCAIGAWVLLIGTLTVVPFLALLLDVVGTEVEVAIVLVPFVVVAFMMVVVFMFARTVVIASVVVVVSSVVVL